MIALTESDIAPDEFSHHLSDLNSTIDKIHLSSLPW